MRGSTVRTWSCGAGCPVRAAAPQLRAPYPGGGGREGAAAPVCRARTVRAQQMAKICVHSSSPVTRAAAGVMRVLGGSRRNSHRGPAGYLIWLTGTAPLQT